MSKIEFVKNLSTPWLENVDYYTPLEDDDDIMSPSDPEWDVEVFGEAKYFSEHSYQTVNFFNYDVEKVTRSRMFADIKLLFNQYAFYGDYLGLPYSIYKAQTSRLQLVDQGTYTFLNLLIFMDEFLPVVGNEGSMDYWGELIDDNTFINSLLDTLSNNPGFPKYFSKDI